MAGGSGEGVAVGGGTVEVGDGDGVAVGVIATVVGGMPVETARVTGTVAAGTREGVILIGKHPAARHIANKSTIVRLYVSVRRCSFAIPASV